MLIPTNLRTALRKWYFRWYPQMRKSQLVGYSVPIPYLYPLLMTNSKSSPEYPSVWIQTVWNSPVSWSTCSIFLKWDIIRKPESKSFPSPLAVSFYPAYLNFILKALCFFDCFHINYLLKRQYDIVVKSVSSAVKHLQVPTPPLLWF